MDAHVVYTYKATGKSYIEKVIITRTYKGSGYEPIKVKWVSTIFDSARVKI